MAEVHGLAVHHPRLPAAQATAGAVGTAGHHHQTVHQARPTAAVAGRSQFSAVAAVHATEQIEYNQNHDQTYGSCHAQVLLFSFSGSIGNFHQL